MLEVSGICKSYGKHRILNGVSFSAGPGQCVGIVGTNGCGKTTLLSILAGALRADSGSIRINGTEILGRSGAAADLTAYVPQENPLIGELSVKDNLLLWHRGSRKEMEKDLTEGCSSVLGIRLGKLQGQICMAYGTNGTSFGNFCSTFKTNHIVPPFLFIETVGSALRLRDCFWS